MPTLVQRSAATVVPPLAPSLSSWRSPAVLQPLSHLVTGSAPSGVVHGATTELRAPLPEGAVDLTTAGPEVSRQRAVAPAASGASRPGASAPAGLPTASPAVGPASSPGDPGAGAVAGWSPAPTVTPAPPRPAVAPVDVPLRQLQLASASTVAGPSTEAGDRSGEIAGVAVPEAPTGAPPVEVAGAPAADSDGLPVMPGDVGATADDPAAGPVAPAVGERPLGLGLPLVHRPAPGGPVVQRTGDGPHAGAGAGTGAAGAGGSGPDRSGGTDGAAGFAGAADDGGPGAPTPPLADRPRGLGAPMVQRSAAGASPGPSWSTASGEPDDDAAVPAPGDGSPVATGDIGGEGPTLGFAGLLDRADSPAGGAGPVVDGPRPGPPVVARLADTGSPAGPAGRAADPSAGPRGGGGPADANAGGPGTTGQRRAATGGVPADPPASAGEPASGGAETRNQLVAIQRTGAGDGSVPEGKTESDGDREGHASAPTAGADGDSLAVTAQRLLEPAEDLDAPPAIDEAGPERAGAGGGLSVGAAGSDAERGTGPDDRAPAHDGGRIDLTAPATDDIGGLTDLTAPESDDVTTAPLVGSASGPVAAMADAGVGSAPSGADATSHQRVAVQRAAAGGGPVTGAGAVPGPGAMSNQPVATPATSSSADGTAVPTAVPTADATAVPTDVRSLVTAPVLGFRPAPLVSAQRAVAVERSADDALYPGSDPVPDGLPAADLAPIAALGAGDGIGGSIGLAGLAGSAGAGPAPGAVAPAAPGARAGFSAVPAAPVAWSPGGPAVVSRQVATGGAPPRSAPGAAALNPGDVAVRAGLAQRSADGSVVFASPAASPEDAQSPAPAAGRPPDVVQREAAAPAPPPEPAAAPASAAPAAPAAPGGAAGLPAGADLDELARRLYGRIRLHLRDELRRDRERASSLIDTGR
jgi:hypothetical protein